MRQQGSKILIEKSFWALFDSESLHDFDFKILQVLVDLVFEQNVIIEISLSFGPFWRPDLAEFFWKVYLKLKILKWR